MTRIAIGDVSCPNCENVELSLSEYWVKLSLFELSCPPWVSSGTTKKLQQHHLQQQLCFIHFYLLVRILRNLGLCNGHNFGHALQNIFLRMTEIERKVSFCLKSEVNTHRFSIDFALEWLVHFQKGNSVWPKWIFQNYFLMICNLISKEDFTSWYGLLLFCAWWALRIGWFGITFQFPSSLHYQFVTCINFLSKFI